MKESKKQLKKILNSNDPVKLKSLFVFDDDNDKRVLFKYKLWVRKFFPSYIKSKDAPFHDEMILYTLHAYKNKFAYVHAAFRGAAKTSLTKLFLAYVIANDRQHRRRYLKVLSSDGKNSNQIVTDIYNMLVTVKPIYPEIFQKTSTKREETMGSFTTSTGVKVVAGTVGTAQRGALQEHARPDFIWFEDFEDRMTLRSLVKIKAIWDNMEEARTSISNDGSLLYTCNYLSEAGNVHKLVDKGDSDTRRVMITPIIKDGVLAWPDKFTLEDIEVMKREDDDFEGERLCKPSASRDVFFNRDAVEVQPVKEPIKVDNGFRIFEEFDPSHEYASGHDIAGGVGLDSSTSVFIDFSTIPAKVVATYCDNTIRPDVFGYEIKRQHEMYGKCLTAPENNSIGASTVLVLKQLGVPMCEAPKKITRIADEKSIEYGWNTNAHTKPKMLYDLAKAINDGLLLLQDRDIIKEVKSYTRNNLMENIKDPRLVTRHFDLLMALAIAWQMKDYRFPSVVALDLRRKEREALIRQNRRRKESNSLR